MLDQRLQYGGASIPYKVFFVAGRRRKIAVHVHPDGSVQVDAPSDAPLPEIKRAVGRQARWLCHHLGCIKEQGMHVLPREYVSGESHFYLGRRYVLKIRKARREISSVKLQRGQLQVATDDNSPANIKSLLWEWYQAHARVVFDRRLDALWQELGWVKQKPAWKLSAMKKQWGSCSPRGVLSLNPHLVKAPAQCIDYVLIHELCHLRIHNHSRGFYRLLSRQMPGWEAVKGRLDGMAELLLNT